MKSYKFFTLILIFTVGDFVTHPDASEHSTDLPTSHRIRVVASFSILGDLVYQIAKDRVELTVLVGPNADAHVYEPTTGDVKALRKANILVRNGFHFEGWMDRLITSSQFKGKIATATDGITPLYGKATHSAELTIDPHAWQSVANMKIYAKNLLKAMVLIDSTHRQEYSQAESLYQLKLSALEMEIKNRFAIIPPSSRIVITSHDAFQYFGKTYGILFIAPNGWSTESNPTAKAVAQVINQIKETKCRALFVENIADPRLMKGIAEEAKVGLGGKLFSDALSLPGQGGETYELMMRHNLSTFVQALTQNP